MKRIAILGLGLMGGSLGLALKAAGFRGVVAGYARRRETGEEALRRSVVDEVFDRPDTAAADADLSVICLPILAIPELARSCADRFKPGSLVTDVGSTKRVLVEELTGLLAPRGVGFVGSHPIAGSEQQGLDAARADLYDHAVTVVTPGPGSTAAGVRAIREFWESVGSRVLEMSPDQHDQILARTSHLPHLAAAALAATVGREPADEALPSFCGPGFRDATRIAAGSPEVWRDIVETNRANLLGELEAFRRELDRAIEAVSSRQPESARTFLEQARQRRRRLTDRHE
jgi:prephenate dehydrogenase